MRTYKIALAVGFSLALVFSFQNCGKFQTMEDQMASSAPAIDFNKAVLSMPPTSLQMPPGANLNETVIVDTNKISQLAGSPSISKVQSKSSTTSVSATSTPAAPSVSFLWRNMTTGQIISSSLNLSLPSVGIADSGRYQLFAVVDGREIILPFQFIDVKVDAKFQVPSQSVQPPDIRSTLLGQTGSTQTTLLQIVHNNPGQIRTVTWSEGATVRNDLANKKSIIVTKNLTDPVVNFTATVSFEDGSTKTASFKLPINDPSLACLATNSCPQVCTEPRITPLATSNGYKLERCVLNGAKLAEPVFVCATEGSVFEPITQSCLCLDGRDAVGASCGLTSEARLDFSRDLQKIPGLVGPTTTRTQQGKDCKFHAQTIHHGWSIVGFKSEVAADNNCDALAEVRVCNNGVLSGTASNLFCIPKSAILDSTKKRFCRTQDFNIFLPGDPVPHGAKVGVFNVNNTTATGSMIPLPNGGFALPPRAIRDCSTVSTVTCEDGVYHNNVSVRETQASSFPLYSCGPCDPPYFMSGGQCVHGLLYPNVGRCQLRRENAAQPILELGQLGKDACISACRSTAADPTARLSTCSSDGIVLMSLQGPVLTANGTGECKTDITPTGRTTAITTNFGLKTQPDCQANCTAAASAFSAANQRPFEVVGMGVCSIGGMPFMNTTIKGGLTVVIIVPAL